MRPPQRSLPAPEFRLGGRLGLWRRWNRAARLVQQAGYDAVGSSGAAGDAAGPESR